LKTAVYIIVNLLLFSSWYVFLSGKRNFLSFADRIIGTFILGLAQIIFTEMLLGVLFRKLFAVPLFLLNISISLIILVLATYTLPLSPSRQGRGKKGEAPFKEMKATNTFPPPLWERVRVRGEDIIIEFADETLGILKIIRKDRILFWIFNLFLISVCWMIFLGYLFPSYAWDALWYHMPIVGYILQSGAIQENSTPSVIDLFINIFPKNIELFFVWNVIFLKSDIIVSLSQLFFTIAGVFTVYSMSVKSGLHKKHALYPPFLFFFAPIVILQSTTTYVDIAVSVLFLIAINFLMYNNPEKFSGNEAELVHFKEEKTAILLAGLAGGILLGAKGSGPLFVVILLIMVMTQEFIKRVNPFNTIPVEFKTYPVPIRKRFIQYAVCFIFPAVLMGGYWYIKNWVLYNNPVYPMEISFFDITLFKGKYKEMIDPLPNVIENLLPVIRPFYVWMENVEYYLYDSRMAGFGPIWFILSLPSIPVALFYAIKRKKTGFLLITVILIFTFIAYPRNWNTRYVIFMLGLGCLSFGLALDYFKERQKTIKIITLLLVVYTFFTANSPCIMPWKIGEFLKMSPVERTVARHAPLNIDIQARQDYGLWIWVNNNMSDGETLAYTFEPIFLSPLWNRSFSNKVIYIKSETFNDWIKALKAEKVTHVLIRQNSEEDKWINDVRNLLYRLWWSAPQEQSSSRFDIVYSDDNYKVVRFKY
jgi:hypothetical protein